MRKIVEWMGLATVAQRERLAQLSGTTVGQLRQIKGGHREASSALACRIEAASERIHRTSPRLPVIPREELSRACAECDFLKRCRS